MKAIYIHKKYDFNGQITVSKHHCKILRVAGKYSYKIKILKSVVEGRSCPVLTVRKWNVEPIKN